MQQARLPALPNATVGRAGDIDAVAELVGREEVRLVTLVGPGGVGKTRLAIEIARAVGERFPDGTGFVALDGTGDVEHVPHAVAGALGANFSTASRRRSRWRASSGFVRRCLSSTTSNTSSTLGRGSGRQSRCVGACS